MTRRAKFGTGIASLVLVVGAAFLAARRNAANDLFAPIQAAVVADKSAYVNSAVKTEKLRCRGILLRGMPMKEAMRRLTPGLERAGFEPRHLGVVPDDEEFYRGDSMNMEMVEIMDKSSGGKTDVAIWSTSIESIVSYYLSWIASFGKVRTAAKIDDLPNDLGS